MLINVKPDGSVSERANLEILLGLALHAGKVAQLDIKRYHPPRSSQQNRTVMGLWMSTILEDAGYGPHEKDSIYRFIKLQCWYEDKVNPTTGEVFRIEKETKNLDTWEYSKEFMQAFRLFVRDFFNIDLPDPKPENARI